MSAEKTQSTTHEFTQSTPKQYIYDKRPSWTTIKVPKAVQEIVSKLAEENNVPRWAVVLSAVDCLEREMKKSWSKRPTSDLDRVSYYIFKLVTAVDRFKLKPTTDNLAKLQKTTEQIKQRLGVNVDFVVNSARSYFNSKDKEGLIEINQATKIAIKKMIGAD